LICPLEGKNYDIISTLHNIIKTYDTQGQEDWNRGKWLDNERMFFQNWSDAPHGIYTIVIYDPFTGEQKNMQFDLPNPYIVEDTGGRVTWVKADIDPTLKRVLYNDKDERLVLWDLDTQKEITFLPSMTDLLEGAWSPDGKKFAIRFPSSNSAPTELFTIDMDGNVKTTSFNQMYPFANVDIWPSWSPDGHRVAYWLRISNVANADPETLRQWLAITDITTLDTQIYCLSPNKPSTSGGNIVWSPDSTKVIINSDVISEEVKPVLVDLTHLTQTELDTHGLRVIDWMAP
jgi:Tol biopolymer transport system component